VEVAHRATTWASYFSVEAAGIWGRAGEGGLEITNLAFLSSSKPPSRTSR